MNDHQHPFIETIPYRAKNSSRMRWRFIILAAGITGWAAPSLGLADGNVLLAASTIAVFLAVTDFGKQCPLLNTLKLRFGRSGRRSDNQSRATGDDHA